MNAMTFNEGDRAVIEQIAYRVGEQLMARWHEERDHRLKEHQAACPAGKIAGAIKPLMVGVAIGAAIVGGGGVIGIIKLIEWLAKH